MTTQPDYNDGQWHGWNGGECPVHPESTIIAIAKNDRVFGPRVCAGLHGWAIDHDNPIVIFRVITPYVEPRKPIECWGITDGHRDNYVGGVKPTRAEAEKFLSELRAEHGAMFDNYSVVKFVEVQE